MLVLAAQLWATWALVGKLWVCHKGFPNEGDITAPFDLRMVGFWTFWATALALLFNMAMPADVVWSLLTAVSWLSIVANVAGIIYAWIGFEGFAKTAVSRARNVSNDFNRLSVYQSYASAFPDRIGPLLSQLHDPTAMRLLKELALNGHKVGGRPLWDVLKQRLKTAPPEVLTRAVEMGLCGGDPELEALSQRASVDQRNATWEAVLGRQPGAPKVGHAMRAILEEALARQEHRVALVLTGVRPTHASGRVARKRIENHLRDVFGKVGLELLLVSDGQDAPADIPFCVTLNTVDANMKSFRRRQEERVQEEYRDVSPDGRHVSIKTRHISRMVDVDVYFPALKIKAAVLRRGRQEAEILLDSGIGLKDINPRRAPSQEAMIHKAVELMLPGVQRGLGLHVMDGAEQAQQEQEAAKVHAVASARRF